MDIQKLMQLTKTERDNLKNTSDNEDNPIYAKLDPVKPFVGNQKIKLIIVGQDPTIRNFSSRKNINISLNLDKPNSIHRYISNEICGNIGIDLQNIYATNLFKYFYVCPPSDTFHVLQQHLKTNVKILLTELRHFKGVPIITLGEPVLKLLTNSKSKMQYYWDYDRSKKASNLNFKYCKGAETILNTEFFPFPHQPSYSRNEFYKNTFIHYLNYFKKLNNF